MSNTPDVPDLRTLLRQKAPSRATASVTVALNQSVRGELDALEARLVAALNEPTGDRLASGPTQDAVDLAKQIEALQAQMRDSEVTFTFRALTGEQEQAVVEAMGGRDDEDELNLRATAAMCVEPAGVTWETLRDLRDGCDDFDGIGARVYRETVDAAANRASGGLWSVPFSSAASLILGTLT